MVIASKLEEKPLSPGAMANAAADAYSAAEVREEELRLLHLLDMDLGQPTLYSALCVLPKAEEDWALAEFYAHLALVVLPGACALEPAKDVAGACLWAARASAARNQETASASEQIMGCTLLREHLAACELVTREGTWVSRLAWITRRAEFAMTPVQQHVRRAACEQGAPPASFSTLWPPERWLPETAVAKSCASAAPASYVTNQHAELGKGTYGTVYRGVLPDGQRVAVKQVTCARRRAGIPDDVLRECAALKLAGQHAHVVRLLRTELAEDRCVLTYDLADTTLRAQVTTAAGPLPLGEVRAIMRGLLLAADHIHSAGVIHRDISSTNVLLRGGQPLLADFGCAQIHTQKATYDPRHVMTLWYRAPEVRGGGLRQGARASCAS
jgi:hypothetical protein